MSSRVTIKVVESYIELVKGTAAREGITVGNYQGGLFSTLKLAQANGTCWLVFVDPANGGTSDFGPARGLRDCRLFLNGVYNGLDAMRFAKVFA